MSEFDGPWKEALDHFFELFVAFFLPAMHAQIDWSKDYESQDQELQKIAPDGEVGTRRVDKLVKVHTRDGDGVLIHIEVQNQPEEDFPRRLYVYNYRAEDRYNQPVVTVAVLGDESLTWRPTGYVAERWGCRKQFDFITIKLVDWADRLEELESHANPFALLALAHLQAQRTQGNDAERQRWKLRLIRGLYERGLDAQDVRHWFRFFDWMLNLPLEMERQIWTELEREEKEKQMQYITSVERIGIEKGIEQGIEKGIEQGIEKGLEKGRREGLLQGLEIALRTKFGTDGVALLPQLQAQQDAAVLQGVFTTLMTANSLDDLRQSHPWLTQA